MNRLTTLDVGKLRPTTLGFDGFFDEMFRYANSPSSSSVGYPPYNIIQEDNHYQIEMAIAGVSIDDLDIEVADGNLTVTYQPPEFEEERKYYHRGIAQRSFKRSFKLSEDVVVNEATMRDGMLTIDLERIIPEEKKPRKIAITYQK